LNGKARWKLFQNGTDIVGESVRQKPGQQSEKCASRRGHLCQAMTEKAHSKNLQG
jgi:hypothetical protein